MLSVEVPHKYAAGGIVTPGPPIPLDNSYIVMRSGVPREQPWKAGDEVTVFNAVSNPEHYSKGMPEGVEVIDIIRAQKGSWELSNAIKYLLRAQFKGNYIQDLEKCVRYLTWEIERNGDPEWRDGTDD